MKLLDELRDLRAEATTGEWSFYVAKNENDEMDCGVSAEKSLGHVYSVCRAPRYGEKSWPGDAAWIVASHNSFPALAARLESYEKALREVRDHLYEKQDYYRVRDIARLALEENDANS